MEDEQLSEFPVLIRENEIVTLFLNKKDIEKATTDEDFLLQLIQNEKEKENTAPEASTADSENAIDQNNSDKTKVFVWPDKAVFLLLELYREREEDFLSGMKRSNKIWTEIAASMKETNSSYDVTGQQCASKMSGLKRTYKNIVDQNKKSGNQRNSWAFFSVLDSMLGDKASTNPPAIATSDGPVDPQNKESSLSLTSCTTSCSEVKSPQRKKKKTDILEEVLINMIAEKEERKEEAKRREAKREESRLDRERRHKEQLKVQSSLVSILQQFLDKK